MIILSDSSLKSLNEKVYFELSKVGRWLSSNKLSLNLSKTEYLLVKLKNKILDSCDFNVTIKDIELEKCQAAKYLGVILDENLDWKPHI